MIFTTIEKNFCTNLCSGNSCELIQQFSRKLQSIPITSYTMNIAQKRKMCLRWVLGGEVGLSAGNRGLLQVSGIHEEGVK